MGRRWRRAALAAALAAGYLTLSGCSTVEYYGQAIAGHLEVMAAARPVTAILDDPSTDATLRAQLAEAQQIRAFAATVLDLPDNDSYRSYADLGRRFVVWNVVATPALSLTPRSWCFPVAGCVAYRGQFEEAAARALAARRAEAGDDVTVAGVRAYSTLGWFDDPLLPGMLEPAPPYLAAVIFHELAHQRLYIADDSAFNEAFATAVEQAGVQRWLARAGGPTAQARYAAARQRQDAFVTLVGDYRGRLNRLYASDLAPSVKLAEKAKTLAALRVAYQELARDWPKPDRFARFFDSELNNARIASLATYFALVPAFEHLLRSQDGALPEFYRAAAEIGALPTAKRAARLRALAAEARPAAPATGALVQADP